MVPGGDQDLAAHVAAFLLGGELVLDVDARGAGLDEGPGDLERVEDAPETGLRVGDDGDQPVDAAAAVQRLDLVGPAQRVVDAPDQLGPAVARIEALVGIHRARLVVVGGDLPARQVDGLEPRPHHLHGLVAGHRAERPHRFVPLKQAPQPLRAPAGERVFDANAPRQPLDLGERVVAANAGKASGGRPGMPLEFALHRSVLRFSPAPPGCVNRNIIDKNSNGTISP